MPINIYFIRHATAEPADYKTPDSQRRLTEEGKRILYDSAEYFKKYVDSVDVILSSPLARAIETAGIIRKIFNVKKEIIRNNSLLNEGNTDELLLLADSLECKNIVMVGHQPDISKHISYLISSQIINLKIPPASIAKISFEAKPLAGKGVLEFLLPPI